MKEWTTDVKLSVAADNTIKFHGHFGEYEITAGENVYRVTTIKGVSQYDAK